MRLLERLKSLIGIKSIDRTARHRPVLCGSSIGNIAITAGTCGCVVTKAGKKLWLSNAHVFCEDPRKDVSKQERRVSQPGKYDNPNWENNLVGNLVSHVVIQPDKINFVDCAICEPYSDNLVDPNILEIGIPVGVTTPTVNMEVIKSGRTSGLSKGKVISLNATIRVSYGEFTATFTEQIISTSISSPGDSGSVVLTNDKNVVGLLFAGSDTNTIINPIANVLKPLGIQLYLGDGEEPPAKPDKPCEMSVLLEPKPDSGEFSGNYVVNGIVQNIKDSAPVGGVDVKIFGVTTVVTDDDGRFSVPAVEPGEYDLIFSHQNFLDKTEHLTLQKY